jgi:hypothetical protein
MFQSLEAMFPSTSLMAGRGAQSQAMTIGHREMSFVKCERDKQDVRDRRDSRRRTFMNNAG